METVVILGSKINAFNAKIILLEREVHYFENDEKMPTLTYY